ncbi:helix-turn-helix transcriptional regulator [Modestobacter versicolor]|uniref:DNA-binding transcriptional regulator n=1 Tax=Modestobacter versicolor TaxID=429133 RepID=A0A323VC24_9ACTN|nr:WYL domain-containing protein [Modestobacter versicolor]MBB3675956.1 putative DNA-binding transcriptional regulator YafY [Modestobacter versicolor]PZA22255.1 DNA-binding transcriptional regulator [Modestobacter versicolor]
MTTSARLLALLGLLQARASWTGPELAARLDVTVRTVRNDVDRLRELGYPVTAVRGAAGHYRLGPGASLPPLLLDDEEAVALAVGLRSASGVAGTAESSARALAKLEQVLPSRLRSRVDAIARTVDRGPDNTGSNAPDPEVDPAVLAQVAQAIARVEWLRFDHHHQPHLVEPYRLVSWQRRWYLVARDVATREWGTFRLDWLTLRTPTGRRFEPEPLAEADYDAFVLREVASSGWAVHARITVAAPAPEVLGRINPAVGVVEPVDDHTCVLVTGADSVETIAAYIGMLGLDFRLTGPPDLVEALRVMSRRYAAAVDHPDAGT